MTWFLIESGVALLVLMFIVWWTFPRRKRRKDQTTLAHRIDQTVAGVSSA